MTRIIAVAGPIGHGKSTVADYLEDVHEFEPVSIAGPLKRIAQEVYGLEHRHLYGTQDDKAEPLENVKDAEGNPRTTRQILEWLGTEGFRTIDPDTWIKLALREAKRYVDIGVSVVFTDTRFKNEFDAVKEMGGEIWLIHKIGGRQETTGHASDTAWVRYFEEHKADAHLVAEAGDLEGLFRQADEALQGGRE